MELTAEVVRALLDYDPETGAFTWKARETMLGQDPAKVAAWNTARAGKPAGVRTHGYIKIAVFDRRYYAHRLAWLHVTGEWPKDIIDHIDCNGENNAFSNLRDVTKVENGRNQRNARKSKSGVPGVYFTNYGKYRSQRKIGDRIVHLGVFNSAEEARAAFLAAVP